MDQNDWQYPSPQHRQRMPDTPPHQNVRRYSHQPIQAPQQSPMQPNAPSQYPYTSPTQSTASPSSRHSITSDFGGINIRDDSHGGSEKSGRPNLSVHSSLRPSQQGSVPSSPTRQNAGPAPYPGNYSHPGMVRTTSDDLRYPPPITSRHSSPMHTASPTMSPYYSTTPHMLNSINEREQTVQWNQSRQSPSRPGYVYPGRDTVSPRAHLQSPNHIRHPPTFEKAQYSPRQATHFPATTPSISPTSYSPRHAMSRDPGSMMSDIVYSNPPPAKFRVVSGPGDLMPTVKEQPKFRRANPDGGFISPLSALTMHLATTYRLCNDKFTYESSRNPRRCLTKPGKGVKNEGFDNEDSDYILYVNDVLGIDQGHK